MAKKKQSESVATKSTMVLRPRTPAAGKKGTMVLRPRIPAAGEEKIEGKAKGKKTIGRGVIRIADSGKCEISRKRRGQAYENNSQTAEKMVRRVKGINKNFKETPLSIQSPEPKKNIHTTGSSMVLRPRTLKARAELAVKVDEKTKRKISMQVNKKNDGKKTVATGKNKIGNAIKIGTSAKRKLAADKGNTEIAGVTHKRNQRVKRKKTNIVVTNSVFPPELIMEILSWLPLKFFGSPMVVCREWYASIQDRHFIENQMNRNYDYTESKAREGYNVVYSCDGLKLEENTSTKKYCIRNPDTKQFLELPDPPSGSYVIMFVYVPLTLNYKAVSIYAEANNIQCCDLSVGNDELSWRLLKMPSTGYLEKKRKRFSIIPTNDVVHCVRVFGSDDDMVEEVVSLDLGTEKFTVTNLPKGQYKNWKKVWTINFKGKLALLDIIGSELCVLVLENYKKQKWGKKEPLVPLELMKTLEDEHGTIFPYTVDESDTLWFWVKDAKKYISYDIKTKYICFEHAYVHSLVRLKGMQPE
ncbi:hypothetical protein DCAR_0209159 [Daucus carota subsp. sativus]|uniref:Uncharacterized protein n=1 Tax=Daucus carota subsp. sativus TaxID=79200 RepID=A0A162AXJ4_DAUCS|nr:hypothetical protein DCAR_0209159 [Daucus carota subsp. sativus]